MQHHVPLPEKFFPIPPFLLTTTQTQLRLTKISSQLSRTYSTLRYRNSSWHWNSTSARNWLHWTRLPSTRPSNLQRRIRASIHSSTRRSEFWASINRTTQRDCCWSWPPDYLSSRHSNHQSSRGNNRWSPNQIQNGLLRRRRSLPLHPPWPRKSCWPRIPSFPSPSSPSWAWGNSHWPRGLRPNPRSWGCPRERPPGWAWRRT